MQIETFGRFGFLQSFFFYPEDYFGIDFFFYLTQ